MRRHAAAVLGAALFTFATAHAAEPASLQTSTPPRRIVSLAPSVTEFLFALGAGERVVGVTRYCRYPAAARDLPKVGGLYDPNWEALLGLEPDLVALLPAHAAQRERLEKLGIPTVVVDHRRLADIAAAARKLGEVCGQVERGKELASRLEARLADVRARTRGLARPRVLVSIGRSFGSSPLGEVYAAGPDTLYDQVLHTVGARNAVQAAAGPYPVVGMEGLAGMDLDAVVDLASHLAQAGRSTEELAADWASVPGLGPGSGVPVHVFTDQYAAVPGPRFVWFVEDLARRLHPEAFPDAAPASEPGRRPQDADHDAAP